MAVTRRSEWVARSLGLRRCLANLWLLVDTPPPRTIEVEVVPEPPGSASDEPRRPAGPPVHPLAALWLVVIDNLWNIPEFAVVDLPVTVPLSFLSVMVPAFVIQKLLKKQSTGRSLGYALLLGVLAAVPFSVTGTPVGLAILAWTGLSALIGRPLPTRGSPPPQ